MKDCIFVEITGGPSHGELLEDRCENFMDMRARWNVSFPLGHRERSYCTAIEFVTRVLPQERVFSSETIGIIRDASNPRRPKLFWPSAGEWLSSIMDTVSQVVKSETPTPDCTVWRFGGRAHFWPEKCESVVVYGEYAASEQHGHALLTVRPHEYTKLKAEFPESFQGFRLTEKDETLLCNAW